MSLGMHDKFPGSTHMADEDFQLLCAIARNLQQELRHFHIELPGGAFLANPDPDKPESQFNFAGMDAIFKMKQKLAVELPANEKLFLIMPTDRRVREIKVGRLFNMDVYISSECPKDRFIIRTSEKGLDK